MNKFKSILQKRIMDRKDGKIINGQRRHIEEEDISVDPGNSVQDYFDMIH